MADGDSYQVFAERLAEIKARMQAASTSQEGEEALKLWEEMKDTIQCLTKIANDLEQSNEIQTAKVAKAGSAKRKRSQVLEENIQDAKEGVKGLLGYAPDYHANGVAGYHMLPKGYMCKEQFLFQVKVYQEQIDDAANYLAGMDNPGFKDYDRGRYRDLESLKAQTLTTLNGHKMNLTRFMMANKPMDAKAFHAKLHPLLDTLHDALKELRTLEASEPSA
jgi:DNA repair exonuclease SbcCD ATPase subunit